MQLSYRITQRTDTETKTPDGKTVVRVQLGLVEPTTATVTPPMPVTLTFPPVDAAEAVGLVVGKDVTVTVAPKVL